MAHRVKCYYCSKVFDRDTVPCVPVTKVRYAHTECAAQAEAAKTEEQKKRDALMEYINVLFKGNANYPVIGKLLKHYTEDLNFSYSGILNTLKYWYEVKGNNTDKANNSIGIVEYQYQNAYNYYYSIWEANQRNESKIIEEYVPAVQRVIHIPVPERNIRKRSLFSFLDEEETNGE